MPNIFLIQPDRSLLEMKEQPYDSEDVLQTLLAQHPSVLAGDQMPGAEPLRWLFIDREAGVPDEESGNNRWALDHLFVDQAGVPTLVEVKRSTDTRIRREVIGQMLDYAANSVAYWPAGRIRELFEESDTAERRSHLTDVVGIEPAEDPAAIDAFWETVDTNLRAGKIRLVFVADAIPTELRRIVEFLNEQMSPAEVFAIEIKQYIGGDNVRVLVPKVIGVTKPPVDPKRKWNRSEFLAELNSRVDKTTFGTAQRIIEWVDSTMPDIWWGEGQKQGSCFAGFMHGGTRFFPFAIWTFGSIELHFHGLHRRRPFDSIEMRRDFARRLNEIAGLDIVEEALTKRPSFSMALLNPEAELAKFFAAMEWLKREVLAAR